MKTYIKNFKSFVMNEAFDDGEHSFEEYIDAIADRMYENGMNGTISSEGNVTAHGRTLDNEKAEVVVDVGDKEYIFTIFNMGQDEDSMERIEYMDVELDGSKIGSFSDVQDITDAMSKALLGGS